LGIHFAPVFGPIRTVFGLSVKNRDLTLCLSFETETGRGTTFIIRLLAAVD
jgi:hypothetical protein